MIAARAAAQQIFKNIDEVAIVPENSEDYEKFKKLVEGVSQNLQYTEARYTVTYGDHDNLSQHLVSSSPKFCISLLHLHTLTVESV